MIRVPIVFPALPKREINDPRPHCFLSLRLVWLISQIVTLAMKTVSDGRLRP